MDATAETRKEMLAEVEEAATSIAKALAALGEAYEAMDEKTADVLESEVFGPVQAAYARVRNTHTGFAQRHGRRPAVFRPAKPGPPSRGAKGFLDDAIVFISDADTTISELQDSLRPIEFGDDELRAGLSAVRRALDQAAGAARRIARVLGR